MEAEGPDTAVSLRDVARADVDIFFEQECDPEALRRANFPARDRPAFVDHWERNILAAQTVRAQTVLAGTAVAGNVVAWWQEGRREVGYWLGREYWGRGIGTRALTLFLQQEAGRPLTATVDVNNAASIRLLTRCGFRTVEKISEDEREYFLLALD